MLLASTSPRRKDLLGQLGIPFEVTAPGVDDAAEEVVAREALARGVGPQAMTLRLALAKLLATLPRAEPGCAVLAADTTVAIDGQPIGKAKSREHARAILGRLRARTHDVHTGVALVDATGRLRCGVDTSQVRMRDFSAAHLEAYLDADCWQGKAGAYGVQDAASAPLVERVDGSDSNVRGLPLELVRELLGTA